MGVAREAACELGACDGGVVWRCDGVMVLWCVVMCCGGGVMAMLGTRARFRVGARVSKQDQKGGEVQEGAAHGVGVLHRGRLWGRWAERGNLRACK